MSEEVTVYIGENTAYVSARDARAAGLDPNHCRRSRVPRGWRSLSVVEDLFTGEYLASIDMKAIERWGKDDRWEVRLTFMDIVWPEADNSGEVIAWKAQRARPGYRSTTSPTEMPKPIVAVALIQGPKGQVHRPLV